MGRLVAHEIYHIESQSREHSKHGVAEAAVSTRELVAERFEFAADAVARLQVPAADGEEGAETDDSAGR
jgi:hypothetical protein